MKKKTAKNKRKINARTYNTHNVVVQCKQENKYKWQTKQMNQPIGWLRKDVHLEVEKFKFIGRISMFYFCCCCCCFFPLISSCCAFRIELCVLVLIIGFVALFFAHSMIERTILYCEAKTEKRPSKVCSKSTTALGRRCHLICVKNSFCFVFLKKNWIHSFQLTW